MKRNYLVVFFLVLFLSASAFSQEEGGAEPSSGEATSSEGGSSDAGGGLAGGLVKTTGAFGTIDIDGKTYKQLSIRPELSIWKLGVGLDIVLFFDENNKIREEDWKFKDSYGSFSFTETLKTLSDKILYVKWAQKRERPIYARIGGLSSAILGHGFIMNRYSNLLKYPAVRKLGIEFDLDFDYYGFETVTPNLKEIWPDNKAFFFGTRQFTRPVYFADFLGPLKNFAVGGTLVLDSNQFAEVADYDGDSIPDFADWFPKDMNRYDVTPSERQLLIDLDVYDFLAKRKSEYFSLKDIDDDRKRVVVWGGDFELPVLEFDFLGLMTYGDFANIWGKGSGVAFPGVLLTMKFPMDISLDVRAEYRIFQDNFLPGYFNSFYDVDRFRKYSGKWMSKKDSVPDTATSIVQGFFAGTGFDLLNMASFNVGFEWYNNSNPYLNAGININSGWIKQMTGQSIGLAVKYDKVFDRTEPVDLFKKSYVVVTLRYGISSNLDMVYVHTRSFNSAGEPEDRANFETQIHF